MPRYAQGMGGTIDQAICLRTWDWSETSQTALIFMRRFGALRVLAKGARRPNAPFSSGLEIATRGEVRVFPRLGGGLSTLASWDLEVRYAAPRSSLAWFHASQYAVELVSSSLTELDPHPRLFDALDAFLAHDRCDDPVGAIVRLQWEALGETGHMPDLTAGPAEPGVDGPDGEGRSVGVYWFAPAMGALVSGARGVGEVWRVRAGTVECLRLVAGGRASGAVGPITWARVARLLDAYLRYALGADLRSFGPVELATETGGMAANG